MKWFKEACGKLSVPVEFISSRGGGDSNQLNGKGLCNIVFGLGMHNIHSNEEFLLEEEYLLGVDILCAAVFPDSP